MTERSGGKAPLFAARAAFSLVKGLRKRSEGRPGRSNIWPSSFGPSVTCTVAAMDRTSRSDRPSSRRLR